jgi:cob(I)alamin adenosyltransferase
MLQQGLIQVYTGKTGQINLSHIGLTLRATGQNLNTFIMGFYPHPFVDTEDRALSFLKPHVTVERLQLKHGAFDETLHRSDKEKINSAIERVQEIISSSTFDIIILEDINYFIDIGVIPVSTVINLIEKKAPNVELVLTGRNAKAEIIEQADLVTEMVEYKKEEGSWKIDGSNQEGCIGVVTGNGKGKTTYCLGRAMFFAANGIRSSVLQFIKSPKAYGEVIAIKKFPNLEIKTMGEGFVFGSSQQSRKHLEAARGAWEASLREIFSLRDRLVILDEINIATYLGLVHPDRVREMMFLKPKDLHLILSGRNAHPEMKEHANAVFEMKEIKHPFHKGIKARRGIEF